MATDPRVELLVKQYRKKIGPNPHIDLEATAVRSLENYAAAGLVVINPADVDVQALTDRAREAYIDTMHGSTASMAMFDAVVAVLTELGMRHG